MPPTRCFRSVLVLGMALTMAMASIPSARVFAQDAQAPEPEPAAEADAPHESALAKHQREVLNKSLLDIQHEREGASLVLPWVLTGTGVALILAGAVIGAQAALGCGDSCKGGSALPGWLMVGGTTAGMAGMIWWVRAKRDIADIETRQYRIKNELERMQWNREPIPHAAMAPSLSFRANF